MKPLDKEELSNIIHTCRVNPDIIKEIGETGTYTNNDGEQYPCKIINKTSTINGTYFDIFINNGTIIQYLAVPDITVKSVI